MPQAEVNIGLVGHVDHGKCIAADESLLLNCSLTSGNDLIKLAEDSGRVIDRRAGEATYEIPDMHTYAFDSELSLRRTPAYLYVQDYNDKLFNITTRTGRQIRVTPRHPFLVNRAGNLQWVAAKDLRDTDYISILGRFDIPTRIKLSEDYLTGLSSEYYVVTFGDYKDIEKATDNFTDFNSLSVENLNKLRLLCGFSHRDISEAIGCSLGQVNAIFSGKKGLSKNMSRRFARLFKGSAIPPLDFDQFVLGDKTKSRYIYTLSDVVADSDLAKWFAFFHAEGTSGSSRLSVSQKTYPRMLNDFFRISKEKFGLSFNKAGDITYNGSSKAVISYLRERFGFSFGNSYQSPICQWILSAPAELKSVFLRWFFTLEAESNKSGEITLTQANKENINIVNLLLLSFGIVPKLGTCVKSATNSKKERKRTYFRLTISGRRDLRSFLDLIGFEDPKKEETLRDYMSKIKTSSKHGNFVVPISFSELSDFIDTIGFKRGRLPGSVPPLKDRPWYKSYEDCRYKDRMSLTKFREMMSDFEGHLIILRDSLASLKNLEDVSAVMHSFGISQQKLSGKLPLSQTEVSRIIKGVRKHTHNDSLVVDALRELCEQRLTEIEVKLAQWALLSSQNILFDKISEISLSDYDGKLVDLYVPNHHNFIAGFGAVISHNTTITKMLSGIWTDRHSEEIRRGISIRLGYADCKVYECDKCKGLDAYTTEDKCPKCGGKPKFVRRVSFVDAPGHETLIATMLSGSALMDGVILVIAADEPCPQPQTKEHLLALKIAGIDNIIVVQNKVDVVDKEAAKKNKKQIEEFLKKVGVKAPIIPIAANYNANRDALIAAIQEFIPTPKRDLTKSPRMFIARSFDINKPASAISDMKGGVLGGSLIQGELRKGDEIEIKPGIKKIRQNQPVWEAVRTTIAGIDVSGESRDRAVPGGLIAIRTYLDPYLTKSDALSGNVLGRVGTLPEPVTSLDCRVTFIERALIDTKVGVLPNESLMLSIGTTVTVGVVDKIKGDVLSMTLKSPIVSEKGTRLAISKRIEMKWRLLGYAEIL